MIGDFNGDGKNDLVVLGSPITFFPGKGNGTFGSPVSSAFSHNANCAASADFNKDGKLDITTGDSVLLGNGDGTFQSPLTVVNGRCDVAVGDFNKDGIPDLVTGDVNNATQVRIFLGDGTGNFKTSTVFHTGDGAASVGGLGIAIDDFNGDAKADVAVSNRLDGDVTMLLNNGNGTFTIGKTFAVSTSSILSGDFNGDHKTDLAVRAGSLGISVLQGRGDGTLIAQPAQNDQTGRGVKLADLNGDGKLDLVEFQSGVLLGNGTGAFGSLIPFPSSCNGSPLVVGDFNHDKKPDIAFAISGGSGGIAVCLGNGDGTFKDAVIVDGGVQHGTLVIGDFNHDGKLDLAASDAGGVSILLGNGDGTFKAAIPTALSGISTFTTGDFNHDGKLDIAATTGNPQITVLLGKGDGTFQSPVTSANPNGVSYVIVAGDLNNDGTSDLVTFGATTSVTNQINILIGNGDGTFRAPTTLAISAPLTPLIRDVNGDGKLDLIVPTSPGLLAVFQGNGDGTFQPRKTFVATNSVTASVAAGDVNGDGLLDVVYLEPGRGSTKGTLIVYLNQGH